MAGFEDLVKGGNIVTGLALGVGFALLAPMVKPLVRPLAKSAIKAGLLAYDQGRVALAELSEHAGDMVAEARAEMEDETHGSEHSGGQVSRTSQPHKVSEAKHGSQSS
jgi:hypothetical protein